EALLVKKPGLLPGVARRTAGNKHRSPNRDAGQDDVVSGGGGPFGGPRQAEHHAEQSAGPRPGPTPHLILPPGQVAEGAVVPTPSTVGTNLFQSVVGKRIQHYSHFFCNSAYLGQQYIEVLHNSLNRPFQTSTTSSAGDVHNAPTTLEVDAFRVFDRRRRQDFVIAVLETTIAKFGQGSPQVLAILRSLSTTSNNSEEVMSAGGEDGTTLMNNAGTTGGCGTTEPPVPAINDNSP
ncbi:unnamed protein product, partial [Amoebophrya sp. A120]